MLGDKFDIGVELLGDFLCDNGLWLLNVFLSEEKLTVEIGEINCIEVNDVNLTEPSEDEVFEELAANAAGADKEDFGLGESCVSS